MRAIALKSRSKPSVRPFQPLRALRALRGLMRNPESTELVFEYLDAVDGRSMLRLRRRLMATPFGRRICAGQARIVERLRDREQLAALPEGSLGRAYLDFARANGIDADGLVAASDEVVSREADPQVANLRRWLRDTHDLWHVATGYGTDVSGELALLAFGARQGSPWDLGIVISGYLDWPPSRALIREALRRGRRAKSLVGYDWEQALERPLGELRAELGLGEPPSQRTSEP